MVILRNFTNAKHTAWLLEIEAKQLKAISDGSPSRWRTMLTKGKFVYLSEHQALDVLTELRQRGIKFDTKMVEL
jgi:hypothetical protein